MTVSLRKILGAFTLTILFFSVSFPLVNADDGDEDGIEDEVEDEEERELLVSIEGNHAVVESQVETPGLENEFRVRFDTENGILLRLEFSTETEAPGQESETELFMIVHYVMLKEFTDDGDGVFEPGIDPVVQMVDLTALDYTTPSVSTVTSQDGESGHRFTSESLGGLTFRVVADIFRSYAVVDNTLVPPTATKITVEIRNFPFAEETTMLALQLNAVSSMEIERETTTIEQEIKVRSQTAEGFFSWANTATADGQVFQVKSSVTIVDEDEALISLIYSRGESIVHDPILGIKLTGLSLISDSTIIGGAIAATSIGAAAFALTRRRLPGTIRQNLALLALSPAANSHSKCVPGSKSFNRSRGFLASRSALAIVSSLWDP